MRWLQVLRSWLMSGSETSVESSRELEALLDLSCYAASQLVACSRLLERELNQFSPANDDRESLLREHSELKSELGHLRETIERLHDLLNSARKNRTLDRSRHECESSRRMISDVLMKEDLRELQEAIKNQSAGPSSDGENRG